MIRRLIVLAAISLFSTPSAAADDYTLVPQPFTYCTTCHGVEFKGNPSVDAPRLNGMAGWYLKTQMLAFKNGWRGTHPEDLIGMEMRPQAAALSEQEIDAVVAFATSMPPRPQMIITTVNGNPTRGKTLYASCAACHGSAGRGSAVLNAPALAGQSDWYLVRQLENYLNGARGHVAEDTFGQQMRAAAAVLPDLSAVRDVVAYINTLSVM